MRHMSTSILLLCLTGARAIVQQQHTRGSVTRVTHGIDNDGTPSERSSQTPRISSDGSTIVFRSNEAFSDPAAAGITSRLDYHIYAADVGAGTSYPYEVSLVYGNDAKKSAAPAVDSHGLTVALASADYTIRHAARSDAGCYDTETHQTACEMDGNDQSSCAASGGYWISSCRAGGWLCCGGGNYTLTMLVNDSSTTRPFGASSGVVDVSGDGSTVVYHGRSNSNYNCFIVAAGGAPTPINQGTDSGERCKNPTISATGKFVAYESKWLAARPDDKEEIWVYDVTAGTTHQVTANGAGCDDDEDNAPNDLKSRLQAYWPSDDAKYNLSSVTVRTSSCNFAAASGLQQGVKTVGAIMPSISGDGRFTVFTTNWDAATALRTYGESPVTTHLIHMFDRLLGITTRVTSPAPSLVTGAAACCAGASSSTSVAGCSLEYRLLGRCCDQKPCRLGGLNPEISSDGQKIVFVSDVDYDGSGVPKGDLELFVHHVPTDTTHRITYTYDASTDETFPHISGDGTKIVFEAKAHYYEEVESSHGTNKDVWMTSLTYGCHDARATNYMPGADIAECCVYPDATLGTGTVAAELSLAIDLTEALGRVIGATAEESCAAWHDGVLADLACALGVPSNQLSQSDKSCAALSSTGTHITVPVTLHSSASVEKSDAFCYDLATHTVTCARHGNTQQQCEAEGNSWYGSCAAWGGCCSGYEEDGGEHASQIASRLKAQLKDSLSPVWHGLTTRYVTSASVDATKVFSTDAADRLFPLVRGTLSRLSTPMVDGATDHSASRWTRAPYITDDGSKLIFYSDSDLDDGNASTTFGDNVYHVWKKDLATGQKTPLMPTQASSKDSKYPAASSDGSTICFLSNVENVHPNHTGSDQNQWWLYRDGSAPTMISFSSSSGRKGSSTCDVSGDGSVVVFSSNSQLVGGDAPSSGDYQLWEYHVGTGLIKLISGAPTDPASVAGITAGSDCYDGQASGDGGVIAFRCKKKEHPDGTLPTGSGAKDEGWLYDRAANKLTLFASLAGKECYDRAALTASYVAYWGHSDYNFSEAGISTLDGVKTSSCNFAAHAGLRSGVGTIGVGNGGISLDTTGRFVVYSTNFQTATAFGTHDPLMAVTEPNTFMFDRLLGLTTRVSKPRSADLVAGEKACCESASSSTAVAGCDWDDRLQGKCCDQKPCRMGTLNPEISSDGQKIVFASDIDFDGSGVPKFDSEIFVHHVPTDTTHRITYTYDTSADEHFPHISGDGSKIVFEATTHFSEHLVSDEVSGSGSNRDMWMIQLTYGCSDPRATNYRADADIEVCCEYADATLSAWPRERVVLTVAPRNAAGAEMTVGELRALTEGSTTEWCEAWHKGLAEDVACALRVPANVVELTAGWEAACAAWGDDSKMAISVDLRTGSDQHGHFPAAYELKEALLSQVREPLSAIWKGYVTRYLDGTQKMQLVAGSAFSYCALGSGPIKTKVDPFAGETGYYTFEGCSGASPTVTAKIGDTLVFDQTDASNWMHALGFAYEPDGAHGSTWGGAELPEVEGAGELLYKIDGAATTCPDAGDTGLDCYEPEFFFPRSEWKAKKYTVELTVTPAVAAASNGGVLYYFCHIHSKMSGKIQILNADGSVYVSSKPEKPLYLPYAVDPIDNTCGTFGIAPYAGGQAKACTQNFLCGSLDTTFEKCLQAVDCAMNTDMKAETSAPNNGGHPARTFMQQMIPHHQNAVNMAKMLLKQFPAEVDAVEDLTGLLWEIINVQNYQIHQFRNFLASSYTTSYLFEPDLAQVFPEPPPAVTATEYVTESVVAAGSIDMYTEAVLSDMEENIAFQLDVNPANVDVQAAAGSVILTITVGYAAKDAAEAGQAVLNAAMVDAPTLGAWLSTDTLTVTIADVVAPDDDGLSDGAIAGIVVGVVLGVACVVLIVFFLLKNSADKKAKVDKVHA